jgi:hypothetical protein
MLIVVGFELSGGFGVAVPEVINWNFGLVRQLGCEPCAVQPAMSSKTWYVVLEYLTTGLNVTSMPA